MHCAFFEDGRTVDIKLAATFVIIKSWYASSARLISDARTRPDSKTVVLPRTVASGQRGYA